MPWRLGFSREKLEGFAVQDVFLVLFQRLDTFEGRSQLRTWLFGILYRKAKERRRVTASTIKQILSRACSNPASMLTANGRALRQTLERLFLSKEIGELITGCMGQYLLASGRFFILREIENYNTADICKILDLTVTHFGVLLYRARARLRECLESKGLVK